MLAHFSSTFCPPKYIQANNDIYSNCLSGHTVHRLWNRQKHHPKLCIHLKHEFGFLIIHIEFITIFLFNIILNSDIISKKLV